jgi:hypothetical protein
MQRHEQHEAADHRKPGGDETALQQRYHKRAGDHEREQVVREHPGGDREREQDGIPASPPLDAPQHLPGEQHGDEREQVVLARLRRDRDGRRAEHPERREQPRLPVALEGRAAEPEQRQRRERHDQAVEPHALRQPDAEDQAPHVQQPEVERRARSGRPAPRARTRPGGRWPR